MASVSTDGWASGTAYEAYMGRWSRRVAQAFVTWLGVKPSAHWLDVGCGTGSLTQTICDSCAPASVIGCDPAGPFVEFARTQLMDTRASFASAGVDALPKREGGFDAIVSGLVLNFLPDPSLAVSNMRERLSAGGLLGAFVWDYAGGFEFLRIFWEEATSDQASARSFDEGSRFPLCHSPALASLFSASGLNAVVTAPLDVPTNFSDFDDFWNPFLAGTGPAPSYVASLSSTERESLRGRLLRLLCPNGSGPIQLQARAWAVRGTRD